MRISCAASARHTLLKPSANQQCLLVLAPSLPTSPTTTITTALAWQLTTLKDRFQLPLQDGVLTPTNATLLARLAPHRSVRSASTCLLFIQLLWHKRITFDVCELTNLTFGAYIRFWSPASHIVKSGGAALAHQVNVCASIQVLSPSLSVD
jgi:hypothetical protein